jgi:SAM-dependent methyltransferase
VLTCADPQLAEVYSNIAAYYTQKILRYGATPLGVDWSCVPTQQLRFVQLLRLCNFTSPFSLNDLGCGYGALLSYLADNHSNAAVDYVGIDLSPAMIRRARRHWRNHGRTKFIVAHTSPRIADYSVASGIFNVKLDQPIERWEHFIATTLSDMKACSRHGFAVNFKVPCSLADTPPSGLYRTSAEPWICYCKQELGLSVELITDYGLREFTLLVRNEIVSDH